MAENEITGYAADRLRKDAQIAEARELVEQNAGVESVFEVPEPYDFPNIENEAAAIEDFRAEFAAEQAADPPTQIDNQTPGDVADPANPNVPEFNQ